MPQPETKDMRAVRCDKPTSALHGVPWRNQTMRAAVMTAAGRWMQDAFTDGRDAYVRAYCCDTGEVRWFRLEEATDAAA